MEPVRIERFYLGCLAHASYMVGSEGICAVIDPQRDVDIYMEAAAAKGWRIEHIIETHLHADFVSGHGELAGRTGAKIYLGAGSGAQFPHVAVEDGDEIAFGNCRMRFLQTPGHTLESICILMIDTGQPGEAGVVFTGDTLFVGDVGRPDLSGEYTPRQLAGFLYESLHRKLLTLPDDTRIFPAHGAGSLCGKQMSADSSSTIGRERATNYALQARSSDEFVHLLTDDLPAAPEYFAQEVELNRRGAAPIAELPALESFSAAAVSKMTDTVVVDTRPASQFAAAHVPGSIHIALTGQYASWAARILGLDKRLVIVGEDPEHVRESQLRLARVGVEGVAGFLDGGLASWVKEGLPLHSIPQITALDLAELKRDQPDSVEIVDVREASERATGAIAGSVGIPLGRLSTSLDRIPRDKQIVVHCKGGYRSSIAASILSRGGFPRVANLIGGYDAWSAAGLPGVMATSSGAV